MFGFSLVFSRDEQDRTVDTTVSETYGGEQELDTLLYLLFHQMESSNLYLSSAGTREEKERERERNKG